MLNAPADNDLNPGVDTDAVKARVKAKAEAKLKAKAELEAKAARAAVNIAANNAQAGPSSITIREPAPVV